MGKKIKRNRTAWETMTGGANKGRRGEKDRKRGRLGL